MAELTISINIRPFAIVCADGEEQRVSRLAEDLAARLGEVKKKCQWCWRLAFAGFGWADSL